MRDRMSRVFTGIVASFDVRDCVLALGLALLAAGLAQVSAALAFGVPGAILVYVAIFGARASSDQPAPDEASN